MSASFLDPWVQTVLVTIPVTVVTVLVTDLLGWVKRTVRRRLDPETRPHADRGHE